MNDNAAESLSASFTDLMTSLAVIFILLLVAATNATVHRFQQAKGKSANDRDTLIKKLREAFADIDIKGDPTDPLGVIVVLPEGLLNFVKNSPAIPEKGQQFLTDFIPKFARVVCATPNMVRSVVVEGHTDNTGSDTWNVRLSQDRATEVAEQTLQLLKQDSRDYGCFLGVMSASGRGENDLIYTGDKVDQGKSRRVEFHLRVPSFEQRNATSSTELEPIQQAAKRDAMIELRHD